MPKVKIVHPSLDYEQMFREAGWEIVKEVHQADLVQFTGGEDVDPALYGEENVHSYVNYMRDKKDMAAARQASIARKPMAGICRGGQFLNVMAGGSMRQHVEGHATGRMHEAWLVGDGVDVEPPIMVTSTHHQMMLPSDGGIVLLTAAIVGGDDCEAVFYPTHKSLCFQPHPEFSYAGECRELYFKFIKDCFGL